MKLYVTQEGNKKYIGGIKYIIEDLHTKAFSKVSLTQALKNYRKKYGISKDVKIDLYMACDNTYYKD